MDRTAKNRAGLILVALLAACQTPSMPRPERSEYLRTNGGGVITDSKLDPGRMYIGATFEWLRQPPVGSILVVDFSHEVRPGHHQTLPEMAVDLTQKDLIVKSPMYSCVVNYSAYVVNITIYANQSKSTVLGTHKQAIVVAVPPDLLGQLKLKDCDA